MKAYLFDTKSGLYEGETFEEPDMLLFEDGIITVPPPDYEHGQVPIFERQKDVWSVVPVSVARQLLNISTSETMEKPS